MPQVEALMSLLSDSVAGESSIGGRYLALYTSFGLVKGRTSLTSWQDAEHRLDPASDVLELVQVTVEHYSSHLPTATFDRLFIKVSDVNAFAFDGFDAQG